MAGLGEDLGEGSWEDEWPNSLRAAVRRVLHTAGISRTEWFERGFDVHHVVAAALDGAAFPRSVMGRWRVNLHSPINAAILPRRFHQGHGLHRRSYLEVVNRRLMSAHASAEQLEPRAGFGAARLIIVKTIRNLGNELVLHSGDVLAARLQAALQEQSIEPPRGGPGRCATDRGRGHAARLARERGCSAAGGADRVDEALLAARRPRLSLAPACGQ